MVVGFYKSKVYEAEIFTDLGEDVVRGTSVGLRAYVPQAAHPLKHTSLVYWQTCTSYSPSVDQLYKTSLSFNKSQPKGCYWQHLCWPRVFWQKQVRHWLHCRLWPSERVVSPGAQRWLWRWPGDSSTAPDSAATRTACLAASYVFYIFFSFLSFNSPFNNSVSSRHHSDFCHELK